MRAHVYGICVCAYVFEKERQRGRERGKEGMRDGGKESTKGIMIKKKEPLQGVERLIEYVTLKQY